MAGKETVCNGYGEYFATAVKVAGESAGVGVHKVC